MSAPETENDQPEHEDVQEGGDAQHSQTHLRHAVCPGSHHVQPHEDNRGLFPSELGEFSCSSENSSNRFSQEIVMMFVL